MFAILRNLINDENGATAIEYGLIAALISVAAIVAFKAVGSSLTATFNGVLELICNCVAPCSGSSVARTALLRTRKRDLPLSPRDEHGGRHGVSLVAHRAGDVWPGTGRANCSC